MPNKTSSNKPDKVELVRNAQVQAKPTPGLLPLNEPLIKKRISRQTKIKVALVALTIAILAVYLVWDIAFHGPLMSLLSNREQLVAAVQSFGPFAPLLYILLQVTQTVVAPIPGQIVGSVGGFIFGPWGILWTTIGTLIGCWLVFLLARRFGRPLLEKIFKKSVVAKFDFILEAKSASLILFAIFLLPGFPDDVVCYLAGLTKLSIKRLMLLVTLGRLPTIILTNYIGAGIGENFAMVAIAALLGVILLGIGVWQRERIMNLLKKKAVDNKPQKS
jgi:uncharacterized membrane protein YdjX (TVP38/TMEM64 family)